MDKMKVGIIGLGNVGSDMMAKVMKSRNLELGMVADIAETEGLEKARGLGIKVSLEGAKAIAAEPGIKICFDATEAAAHPANASILEEAGKICFDMTPAGTGTYIVPFVRLAGLGAACDYSMISCGGQAAVPIVAAINEVADVEYAEVVVSLSTKSAGAGTCADIDEFTQATAEGLRAISGADASKAIIVLNPAEPPLTMANTIYCRVKNKEEAAIKKAVGDMVAKVQGYVPGYRLRVPPLFEDDKVTCIVQVEGAGGFLPAYAGNLDISTSAAVIAAEAVAERLLKGE